MNLTNNLHFRELDDKSQEVATRTGQVIGFLKLGNLDWQFAPAGAAFKLDVVLLGEVLDQVENLNSRLS